VNHGSDLARGNIPYSGICVLYIWCTGDRGFLDGNRKMARNNFHNNRDTYIRIWYALGILENPYFLLSNLPLNETVGLNDFLVDPGGLHPRIRTSENKNSSV
jgi:hypothetical protein